MSFLLFFLKVLSCLGIVVIGLICVYLVLFAIAKGMSKLTTHDEVREAAEKWARNCVQQRGVPHTHDLSDAFVAGAEWMKQKCESQLQASKQENERLSEENERFKNEHKKGC